MPREVLSTKKPKRFLGFVKFGKVLIPLWSPYSAIFVGVANVKCVASCPWMQLQHQSRLQPLGQARSGGECPFFARASLPPGVGTIVCVSHGMRRLCAVVVQSHLLPLWANSGEGGWRSMSEMSVLVFVGVAKTVLLANRAFVPCQKDGFCTKRRKMTNFHSNPDLFSRRFREGISFPRFVGEVHPELPLSKLCAVPLGSTEQSIF